MTDHRVFFEYDPEIKRTVWLVFNEKGELRGAHVEQEVDDIWAVNAEAEKATHGNRFGEWNHAASVPLTLMEKTGLGDAIDARDQRYVSKVLNDSDYSKVRTSRGRV
jgi:hypothetical protein